MRKTNLNTLARDLTLNENLKKSLSIAQVKEILALLGLRWRNLPTEDFLFEVDLILKNAGKSSQHTSYNKPNIKKEQDKQQSDNFNTDEFLLFS